MSSLKIVVFPGPEGVAYTTEKRTVPVNPVIDFLSQHSSTRTHEEQIYTIKQITNGHVEAFDKPKNTKNGRQLVCPPILDLAMKKCYGCDQLPAHKQRRIINGFFPSKIRTTNMASIVKDPPKEKQDPFEDLLEDDSPSVSYLNGAFSSKSGSKYSQISERSPSVLRTNGQQHQAKRVALTLRNGSPSPWINRYQLKKKSISACNTGELKSQPVPSRGFSR